MNVNELKELANPLIEYLKNNYDPHTTIILNDQGIKIVRDETYVPIKKTANKSQSKCYGSSDNPMTKEEWIEYQRTHKSCFNPMK